MSRLLRRIKRSRTAADGVPPAEGQAAGPEAASTTTDTGDASAPVEEPRASEAPTTRLPATEAPAATPPDAPTAKLTATAPVITADPDRPAGLEERAPAPAPAGRRGRLRKRLRYLRRARELMLRDLGGLVYEVNRSGGGDYTAHGAVIRGKVERLTLLDTETGAIEQALGAPRGETAVFEPGVGGNCAECGELYSSSARFCANCGSPTDPAIRAAAAPEPVVRHVPPMPKSPGTADTQVLPGGAKPDESFAWPAKPAAEQADAAPADEPAAKPADEPTGAVAAEPTGVPAAEPADDPAGGAAPEPAANPADEAAAQPAEEAAQPAEVTAAAPAAEPKPAPKRRAARPKPKPDAPAAEPDAAADAPADKPAAKPRRKPAASSSNGRAADEQSTPELSPGDPLAGRESRQ